MDKPLLKCRGWRSHAVSTTKGRDSGAPAKFTTEMESSHSSHAQNPFSKSIRNHVVQNHVVQGRVDRAERAADARPRRQVRRPSR